MISRVKVSKTTVCIFTARRKASFASAVYAMANPSVRPSVRHTPVSCQNEGKQRDAVFTVDFIID